MDLGVDGRSAIVTASSSGLGKASAEALAAEGANVTINGRDEARLEAAAEEIRQRAEGDVITHAGDITDPSVVSAIVDRTVAEFGGLDHLVANVGGPTPMTALEPTDADWEAAFELLVLSAVRLVRAAADHLRADGGGSIVTIASMAAKEPRTANVLSGSIRSSVINFQKILSQELAPAVRSNTVLPGYHDTPRIREYIERVVDQGKFPDRAAAERGLTAEVPLERMGRPEEFGATVAFLCSDCSGYLNGVAIPVDGGRGSTAF